MDPVLGLVIIVALVCITVVTVVLTKRGGAAVADGSVGRGTVPEEQPVEGLPAPALQNISFRQALEGDALATGLEELTKRQVGYALGLNSATAVVQAVSLSEQHDELVVAYEFSRSGTTVLEKREELIPLHRGGEFLPMLRDASRGRFAALVKGTPISRAKAPNTANMMTGVAHVIAGLDVLHGLKEIDRRLSALAAGRTIDQLAEIETIYNRLSEIFSREDWTKRRFDLMSSRDQLFKLRATWRRELEQALDSAPNTPDTQAAEGLAKLGAVFFPPAFFISKGLEMHRESEEEKLFGHLAAAADLIQRIRLAMLLDISVSQALGEAETLAGVAMRNELEMWEGIVEKFQSKRKEIRTFHTPGDLQTVEDALQGYVSMLSSVALMKTPKPGPGHANHEDSSESDSAQPIGCPGIGADSVVTPAWQLYSAQSHGKLPQENRLQEGKIARLQKALGSGGQNGEEQAERG